MRDQRSVEIRVGIVSFVAIGLAIVGFALGTGWAVPGQTKLISIRFPNSGGLQPADPVTVNGVRRGQIADVRNDGGSVLVRARLDNTDDLSSDASATITMLEITGGKKVEIVPGISAKAFDPSHEISGTTAKDVAELVALAGDLSEDAVRIIRNIDTMTAAAKDLLSDEELLLNVRQSAARANKVLGDLEQVVSDNKDDVTLTLQNVKELTTELKAAVEQNSPAVDTLLRKLDRVVEDAGAMIANVDQTVTHSDELIGDIKGLVHDVKSGKGLASRLLYDEQLGLRMDSTLQQLRRFVDKIYRHGLNTNVRIGTRP